MASLSRLYWCACAREPRSRDGSIDGVANAVPPDPEVVARKRGFIAGIALAIAATVVAYLALWLPTSATIITAVWTLFLGPIAAGLVLLCIPKTRSVAAGLLIGAAFTWIVSVPTCVLVSVNTVPDLFG